MMTEKRFEERINKLLFPEQYERTAQESVEKKDEEDGFIERTAEQLMNFYKLDSADYSAARDFFDDDAWYELRNEIHDALEELDDCFDSLQTYPDKGAERDYKLKATRLIGIWNTFANIAKKNYENGFATDDGYNYIFWRALNTDGWAISHIPLSIISSMVTMHM